MCGSHEGYDTPADKRKQIESDIRYYTDQIVKVTAAHQKRIDNLRKELAAIK